MNRHPPLALPSLVALYNNARVNHINGLAHAIATLETRDLLAGYLALRDTGPRRHHQGKLYFTGRTGVTSSGQHSNRREEHLAVALRNTYDGNSPLQLPDGRPLTLLDYQVPLKARRADTGIGKIDLFGVIAGALPCVIELKVPTASGGCSDTPLRAFLEGIAYCAIVEANIDDLAGEALESFGCTITPVRPALMVMAPEDYWLSYLRKPRAGDWWPPLERLATDLAVSLSLESHFIALRDAHFDMGLAGNPPRLTGACLPIKVSDLATAQADPARSST
jgi:hypothetical protein